MPKINGDQRNELFLLGQMAKEVGDYFILIKRLEEAKEEYKESVAAYEMIPEGSSESDAAMNNKAFVQRILNDLNAGKIPAIEDMRVETAETLKSEPSEDLEHLGNIVINGIKYVISWLSPVWQPHLAGLVPSAADISEKHHSFDTDDGEISISCQWKGESEDEPAYILVKWKANITGNKELLIRFVNPDTQMILSEFNMGTIFVGEESFTKDELGFDPFCENWGISVALTEKSS